MFRIIFIIIYRKFIKSKKAATNSESLIRENTYIFSVINSLENRNPASLNFFK